MRKLIGMAAVVLLLASGCSRTPSSPPLQTATATFLGYSFVFEYAEGTGIKHEGHQTDDGAGHATEDITVTCGEQVLRIVDGKLKLNGADRGTVKQGDSIKLTSTGKLWVNQQPRGE